MLLAAAREADKVFYTLAGPEISVLNNKTYSAQLWQCAVWLFVCKVKNNKITETNTAKIIFLSC